MRECYGTLQGRSRSELELAAWYSAIASQVIHNNLRQHSCLAQPPPAYNSPSSRDASFAIESITGGCRQHTPQPPGLHPACLLSRSLQHAYLSCQRGIIEDCRFHPPVRSSSVRCETLVPSP